MSTSRGDSQGMQVVVVELKLASDSSEVDVLLSLSSPSFLDPGREFSGVSSSIPPASSSSASSSLKIEPFPAAAMRDSVSECQACSQQYDSCLPSNQASILL